MEKELNQSECTELKTEIILEIKDDVRGIRRLVCAFVLWVMTGFCYTTVTERKN